ncbi:MAG: asparaginase [Armatimonadota bacterium]|nr:asparaginase [Armatimonadota bacterium]
MDHPDVPLAHVTRDGVIESTHYGRVAVCSPDGRLLASAGDPEQMQFWRSSAKPIQALSVVTSGAADRFELTETELAVCCASHHGSAEHVATVRGILGKLDLDVSHLQCGTHWPGDSEERNRLIREHQEPSPLHNNCSGKHAGMLASCLALDAEPAGYPERDHPVQRLITLHLSVLSGVPEEEFVFGRDGCGVPTVAMPLTAMARAFARLARPGGMPADLPSAATRIRAVMAAAPVMVSGAGSFNTELLAACDGDIIAKGGAEGLFCLASAPRELGIAFKFADGSGRAHAPVALALMRAARIDVPAELAERFERPEVRNCHDEVVGHIEPAKLTLDMMA